MRIFDFDYRSERATYAEQGWLYVKGGATEAFCHYVSEFLAETWGDRPLEGKGIRGAKDQFTLELPPGVAYTDELFDVVADLCGLARPTMTLSERHIKAYQADADPSPTAHKDRYSSQVAVGVAIEVPSDSQLVLYPDNGVGVNPLLRAGLIDTLPLSERPEVVLANAREVTVADAPGDVVAFPGSAVWHLRRHSARTVNVYFKFNDFGCDPLGEDPATAVIRRRTLELVTGGRDFLSSVPHLGRRFESVTREELRSGGEPFLAVNVWGAPARSITELELLALRAVDGQRTVDEIGDVSDGAAKSWQGAIRRLADVGALDLLSA